MTIIQLNVCGYHLKTFVQFHRLKKIPAKTLNFFIFRPCQDQWLGQYPNCKQADHRHVWYFPR